MTLPVTASALEAWLVSRLAESCALEPDRIDVRERFSRYGLDSLRATRLIALLSAHLGRPLSATLVWEQPTIKALVAHLTGEGASSPAPTGEFERAYGAQEPIAIVGMACRFPGAPDPASFWRLLRDGVTAVSEVPHDRGWDELLSSAGIDPAERDKVRRGAFLERIDTFDPLFFGISPREAIAMDPQQRLMLELCWEALEDGGIRPESLRGTRTGVFAGAIWSDYASLLYRGGPESLGPYTVTGSHHSLIANRISYVFGLEGSSLALDSACSSGLVVAHLACESLRRGESRVALAGAVNLNVLPESALAVSRFGALSPDGRCYTFDARANGYVRGEGGGVLVLKTLSRALADGDPIRAVIRGAAVNNDGASNGLTAPSRAAQEAVLREACLRAGVRPEAVQYIEAHGTGTPLGDPIEARALGAVFGASRPAETPLLIGSVKTNVGHLEGAAGIAGLAKVVLAIENRVLPPSLHFESPNPHAELSELGLEVTTSARPWPAPEQPLTAGVSSFGLGGTNGHVVVQEWPGPVAAALSTAPAKALLARGADGGKSPGVVFVFPGQGAQWHGMALTVLHSEPVFRAAIEACDQHIRRFMGWSLLEELTAPREASRLDDIEVSLPAIIAIAIAVSAWWRSMGIEPAAVVGHSTGEIAAAHVAGALDLEDTMRVICAYGRFVGRFSGRGGMAFVGLPWDEAQGALAGFEGRVFRAIQDSAEGTVVAGEPGAIAELLGALQARGVFCRPVAMNVAPHSPLVDSVREELFEALQGIRPRKGSIPLISEVTGAEIDGRSLDAAHWVRNFGDPAFFSRAIDELIGRGHRVFLDVGPHPITRHSVETNLRRRGAGPEGGGGVVLSSLRRDEDGRSTLRGTLATLHSLGAQVRWDEPEPTGNDASLPGAGAWLLPLSAKSPEALTALAGAYADLLKPGATAARLRDITYTASVRREHHAYRLAVAGRSREELSEALAAFARGDAGAKVVRGQALLSSPLKVAFVFPGQGSQWLGMGRTLLGEEPVFRAAIEACEQVIADEAGFSVLAELHADEATSQLGRIDVVQPVLFAVEVALAALWRSWGVTPDCVVGHSMGEVAAAHVAGIVSLPDAVQVICRRSRLLRRMSGQGAMGLVELTAAEAEKALAGYEDRLSVAVCNGPRSTVISGDPAALGEVLATLEERGVFCRRVKVDVASHSPQMDPLLGELLSSLREVRPGEGRLAMRSTVTGAMVNGLDLDADYWAQNLRAPVRFAGAVQALVDDGHALFVEISPHPILLPAVDENIREQKREGVSIASVRRGSDERRSMLEALGAAWTRGAPVDLGALYPAGGRVVALPVYPWQRERYWVEAAASEAPAARGRSHAGGHPLLGRGQTLSTQTGTRLWETTLDVQRLPWLRDHQVQGVVVFPGAGTLEMALAAGEEVFDRSPFLVTGVSFVEVLALEGSAATEVQVVTTEEQPGRLRFQVASHAPGAAANAWTVHARGTLSRGEDAASSPKLDLSSVRARLGDPEPAQLIYAELGEMGLDYGPAFRGLVELWSGEGEALGRVQLPEAAGTVTGYRLHPALLDACFHVLAGALRGGDKASWMPVEVGSLRMLQRPLGDLFCHATIAPVARGNEKRRSADLVLVDAQGILVAEIQGLVVERLSSRAPRREADDWFLELAWEAAPVSALSVRAGRFLLLGDGGGLGAGLRAALLAAGHMVVQAVAGAPGKVPAGCWPVDDASPTGVRALLADAFGGQAPSAVVHLRSLEGNGGLDAEALEAAFARGYDSALHTVQALSGMGYRDAPRLWLVTRGAQAVGNGDIAVEQAPLLGLSRVIAVEHHELRCARVDLDPARPEHEIEALSAEVLADGAEHEVALRGGERRVARLVHRLPEAEPRERIEPAGGRPFRLTIDRPGVLDDLVLRVIERRAPGPGEVEIAVEAAGLNFIDVMKAMAIYPGTGDGPPALGGECAGRIVAVGEGSQGFTIGQEVLAVGTGSFSTHITVGAQHVALRPAGLTTAQAAAAPLVFATAWYALVHLARLKAGERVLIHSATGGTGLAAVQIARHLGAEIFATAGSPAKRAWLREQGIAHVMDSRSLRFAEEVLAATGGQGVDVVLNSLSGAAIEASLSALAPDGRFLELGKTDIYADRPLGLAHFKKSLSYSAVDLAGMIERRPERFAALLHEVVELLATGVLAPLPVETFPMARAADAFRKMAQAQHLGKLVLTLEDPEVAVRVAIESRVAIRRSGSYLVTGGLGGLGLSVAGWLAEQGAGHLVLLGRGGAASPEQQAAISAILARGTRVTVARADVADRAALERLLAGVVASGMPLSGIVHAAGVLDDGLVAQQTSARFRRVMAPKILGALHLHELTRGLSLDFFVMYASVAGLLGSPGQGNYAAANTFLDALAHHRRAKGLPATSIDWGGFSEVGLAAAQDNRGARLASRGMRSLTPAEGLTALRRVLDGGRAQVGVAPLDVRQWVEFYPVAASSPTLSRLLAEAPAGAVRAAGEPGLVDQLARAEPAARISLLLGFVRGQVARVLRIAEGKLDPSAPLTSFGMDSLTSLELRNRLEAALGVQMPATLLWTYPTVTALCGHLGGADFGFSVPSATAPAKAQPAPLVAVSALDELSDDALMEALRSEL